MMETQSATQMSSSVKMATSTADCAAHPGAASRRLTFMAAATSIVASRKRDDLWSERGCSLSSGLHGELTFRKRERERERQSP